MSAEDCGCVVAIECLPEDKEGVKGELVRVEATEGRPIQIGGTGKGAVQGWG